MKTGRWIGFVAFLAAVSILSGCTRLPAPGEFQPGATRSSILERHGPPASTQTITKTGDAIWGPIENFWPRVARGIVVEVWAYRVEGGTVELYFVDGSQEVRGTGFAPEGALFESEP